MVVGAILTYASRTLASTCGTVSFRTEHLKRIKRAKLFIFLREWRHELFDESLQAELSKVYADAAKGHPPVPPAQLALTTIFASLHWSIGCRSN